jgi:hypothetical protein
VRYRTTVVVPQSQFEVILVSSRARGPARAAGSVA